MTAAPSPERVQEVVLQSHGNFERVRQLIGEEPALLTVSAPWRETPIQAASHMGRADIAEWLIARGAPLDIFTAAMLGRRAEVEAMLAADPSLLAAGGVHGLPLLYFPAAGGQEAILALFLDRGADVNAGAGGNTALHAAAQLNRPAIAAWLMAHGADPEALDYDGKTPRMVAEDKGFDEVVAALG